jgi:hypothetical protein
VPDYTLHPIDSEGYYLALKVVGGYEGGVNKIFVGDSEVANEVDPTNTDAVVVFIDPLEPAPTTITVISSKAGNLPITKTYTVSNLNYAVSLDLEVEAGATVVYGETVSDLQTGVAVDGTDIEGTLAYVEGYTAHPVDTEGYFLALKVVGGYEGGVNKIYVGDSETANVVDPVTGAIVVFIDPLIDPAPTSITLKCTKTGFTTVTKVYSIEALVYGADPTP